MEKLLTPEIIGSLKTLASLAGIDLITGSISNKLIGRASIILSGAKSCLDAVSVMTSGLSNLIQRVQKYGDETTD